MDKYAYWIFTEYSTIKIKYDQKKLVFSMRGQSIWSYILGEFLQDMLRKQRT